MVQIILACHADVLGLNFRRVKSYFLFRENNEAAMDGDGGRVSAVLLVFEPKKAGANNARVRTRGQTLQLYIIRLFTWMRSIAECG